MEKQRSVGGLWQKKDRNGNTFFSGKVGEMPVVIFKNGYKKEGSNEPDWRVFESKPREEAPAPVQNDLEF